MSVLSIQNRIVWGFVGLVLSLPLFYLTYHMYMNEGDSAGLASYFTAILGIAILRQFLFAPPQQSFGRWWKQSTGPGYYGTLRGGMGGMKIIRPVLCDFSEVYDLNGDLLGHEQDIWNDGHWTFTPVAAEDERRMPLIAYWRTKAMRMA